MKTAAPVEVLKAENLSVRYGGRMAVRSLQLTVGGGTVFGLIGPDGAGKSTALRAIIGLERAHEGSAWIMGRNPAPDPRRIAPLVGYMPQKFSLYPDLTVQENLRFFAALHSVNRSRGSGYLQWESRLLESSLLEPFRTRRAGHLSGGMKQKLALACALVHSPPLLVLDEPTVGLDPVSRQEFWRLLRELAQGGTAVLVATPDFAEADRCDRVALMHSGKLLAADAPERLLNAFPGKVWRVEGAEFRRAGEVLRNRPVPGVRLMRAGDHWRAYSLTDVAPALRERLAGLEVAVEPAAPNMEDVFWELTARM